MLRHALLPLALVLAAAAPGGAAPLPKRTPLPAGMRAPGIAIERPATPGPWPLLLIAPAKATGLDSPLLKRLASAAAEAGWLAVRFEWRFQAYGSQPSADLATEARQLDALAAEYAAHPDARPGSLVLAAKSLGTRVAARSRALAQARGFLMLTPNADATATFEGNYAALRGWDRPLHMVISAQDPYGDLGQIRGALGWLGPRASLGVLPRGDHDFRTGDAGSAANEARAVDSALKFLGGLAR